jgi:hypothetical protein
MVQQVKLTKQATFADVTSFLFSNPGQQKLFFFFIFLEIDYKRFGQGVEEA